MSPNWQPHQLACCASAGATELAQLFKNLGTPLSMEKVAEVFMRYDKDESGQIEFGG
jgi:Ca2+-binding EF-hand superfamily protein